MEEGLILNLGPSITASEPHQPMSTPGLPEAMTAEDPTALPDLQLLAQQTSETLDLPNQDVEQTQENVSPILSTAPIIVPISSADRPNSRHLSATHDIATMNETIRNTLLSGSARGTSTEQGNTSSPDLIDQQFQDEPITTWPQSQHSDATYGASHQHPAESIAESEEPQIQAFAKLEFEDGQFYMNTYAVELGRDIQAAREASERESEARRDSASQVGKRSASRCGSAKSGKSRKEDGGSIQSSVAGDDEGVIVNHRQSESGKKTKRKKSKSWSSSSRPLSRGDSMRFAPQRTGEQKTDYNALAMASLMDHSEGINGFAIEAPMPSPDLVPLIPIHPPTMPDGNAPGHKSISRKHIRIAFNFTENLFQVDIMGRNGVFIDEHWYPPEDVLPLVNGSMIQIGGVGIRFVLPDVPLGETGADMGLGLGDDRLAGGRMSLEMAESGEDESEEDVAGEGEGDNMTKVKQEEGEGPELSRTRGKGKKKTEAPQQVPTKRKGPGRPPKNGIISKREQALLARQAKEEAKAKAEGKPVPVKGKNNKDPTELKQQENLVRPNGRRKYVKRNRAGGTEDPQAVRESTEHTDSVPPEQGYAATLPPKPTKEKKPVKPPRSPSPVFDESKMTPEQLAKPQASYVVLIHDALTNSKTGQMSLPQIYRAIERQYPYYKLRVQTQGWQSSVRHNLSQHPAFTKIERDGKGWMWGLVPEISIEKEKKRRTTPPPQVSQQHYYPPHPIMQHPYPYHGMPPSNGHMPQGPYGMHAGMQMGRMPYPPPPRPGFPLPLVNAQSESTYRSPYQPTPPPAASQTTPQNQQLSQTTGANGQYPTPVSQPPTSQSSGNYQQSNGPGPYTTSSPHPQQPPASSVLSSVPSAASFKALSNVNHQQDVNQAVSKFKIALINNMDDKVQGEILVTSAINRVLGIQDKSNLPSEENLDETTIMKVLSTMLGDLGKQNMEAKEQSFHSTSPTDATRSLDATPQNSESRTATAIAAEDAAKTALADGDVPTAPAPGGGEATNSNRGTKRPLDSDEDGTGPEAQRVAKRVAI